VSENWLGHLQVLCAIFARAILLFCPTTIRSRPIDLAGNRIPSIENSKKVAVDRMKWLLCDISDQPVMEKRRGKHAKLQEKLDSKPEKPGAKDKESSSSSGKKRKPGSDTMTPNELATHIMMIQSVVSDPAGLGGQLNLLQMADAEAKGTGWLLTANAKPGLKMEERPKRIVDDLTFGVQEPIGEVPMLKIKERTLNYALDIGVAGIFMPGQICMAKNESANDVNKKKKFIYPKVIRA
jgi:hypothetical protein